MNKICFKLVFVIVDEMFIKLPDLFGWTPQMEHI